eukprot:TRINITY_DN8660_c0_g2_i1.p1 TRINITY_DN8660_c0_g2~~TRINITY_DN8660_c0_g2_i1.p1  ORF type:complete len:388 (+),score=77.72 TRINITY_DN8660_c0_g2_i1:61-1224(+)
MKSAALIAAFGTTAVSGMDFGWCFLKYSAEGSVAKSGVTSCVLNGQGNCTYVADRDIQNSAGGRQISSPGAESCCQSCLQDSQCKAAVHMKNPQAGTTCSSNIAYFEDPSPNMQQCEGFKNCGYNCGVNYTYPSSFKYPNSHKWYTCKASNKRIVVSNGIPSHNVTVYNPNDPCVTNWQFEMPLTPKYLNEMTETQPVGAIGVQLDGVPMFGGQEDPFDGDSNNAIQPPDTATVKDGGHWFGHTSPQKIWHYHAPYVGHPQYPTEDELVGYAFDGFPIYGAVDDVSELDGCNGKVTNGEYRYHIRKISQVNATINGKVVKYYCNGMSPAVNWNYILGCYHGDISNFKVSDSRYTTIPSDCVEEPQPDLKHMSHVGGRVIISRNQKKN